jgi:hypothetical protein
MKTETKGAKGSAPKINPEKIKEEIKSLALPKRKVNAFEALTILNDEDKAKIAMIIKDLKTDIKAIEEKAKPFVDEAKALKKSATANQKNWEAVVEEAISPYQNVIDVLNQRMTDYLLEQQKKAEKLAIAQQLKENKRAEKLSEKYGEEVQAKVVEVEKVRTDEGVLMHKYSFVVTDVMKLPAKFHLADQVALNVEARSLGMDFKIEGGYVIDEPYYKTTK